MSDKEIRAAYAEGNSTWEILHMLVDECYEFPDASFKVSRALRLKPDEREEMEERYMDCA